MIMSDLAAMAVMLVGNIGLTRFYRCNNILWMGDASGVEMTELGLK